MKFLMDPKSFEGARMKISISPIKDEDWARIRGNDPHIISLIVTTRVLMIMLL